MSLIRIATDSATPPYEQIRSQIEQQIADGALAPGTRLPAVRRLAGDLGLAPNTVARAYRELEAAGLVRTAGRNGTVVAADRVSDDELAADADTFIDAMAERGVAGESLLSLVRQRIRSREMPSG